MKELKPQWKRLNHLLLLAVVLLPPTLVQGQIERERGGFRPDNPSSPTRGIQGGQPGSFPLADNDTSATKGLVFHSDTPDSLLKGKVFFFPIPTLGVKIHQLQNPILDPTGAQYHDPLDAPDGNYYLSTGVLGHPHLALYPTFGGGFQHWLQDDEHEGYAKTLQNINLYQTLTPYSRLSYGSSLNKDYSLAITHTQNMWPGWNAAFDYRLINPEGPFVHSAARNHYLDATTNYFSQDSRLQALAAFIFQRYTIDENGGLSDDSYFTSGRQSNQAGLPMHYSNSGSVTLRHDAFSRISYNLVQQVVHYRRRDSLTVRHDTVAPDSVRMVLDTIVRTDTLQPSSPHTLNAGAIGLDVHHKRTKRAAYIEGLGDSTLWSETAATLFWTNDVHPDHRWRNPLKITIGIKPQLLRTHLLGDTLAAASALNPYAKAELALKRMTLTAEGEANHTLMAMLPQVKEPEWRGCLELNAPLDTNDGNTLAFRTDIQHSMPTVRMLLTAGHSLKAQEVQRHELRYRHRKDSTLLPSLDLSLCATHLSHALWYDTALAVQEGGAPLWLLQASLTASLRHRWLCLDMQQLVQYSTDDVQVGVPLWTSKNSLYGDWMLFRRALRMQVGIDVRFHSKFYADAYDPGTGLFHQQEECEVGGYVWGDVFVNLQVKRATIYAKAGHVNALWERQPQYLLLPHYPGQGFGLMWGLTWNFFD